uniref:Nickel insertion protein n=1 Tax=Hyaloperonospora arabidopsidis (strain Emoy2) TaxID=559515 RepID=M4B3E3_HYAAE
MALAYIDCSAGIAGDMLLGALIDAVRSSAQCICIYYYNITCVLMCSWVWQGASLAEIKRGLESLHGIKGEWQLSTAKVWKGPGNIAGTKVHVSSIYQHKEVAPPSPVKDLQQGYGHGYARTHSHGHGGTHSHEHERTHNHGQEGMHNHEHKDLNVDGVDTATGEENLHDHDHSHDHDHDHALDGHEQSIATAHDREAVRNLDDIKALIAESDLSDWVKAKSVAVFTLLAQAEAHTHGTALEKIHFHEVGAIDSIVDTIGSVIALDLFGVREVHASFVPFSSGTVKCMHGILPVPPPATFRLMIGVPVCPAPKGANGELVTPTGISLVKALASTFGEPPAFIPTHTGVGADRPFGSRKKLCQSGYRHLKVIGYVSERLLSEHHALDVWKQPIQMKKNRPGVCLSVLCRAEHEHEILEILFRETSTLGVRRNVMERFFLPRNFVSVLAFGRSVDVKVAFLGDQAVNVHPEFEHCKARRSFEYFINLAGC